MKETYITKNIYRVLSVTFSFMILFAVSCNNTELKPETSIQVPESEGIEKTIPESGTLRLWMQRPDTMNPLTATGKQWQSFTYLFYESLFVVDKNSNPVPVIVSDWDLSPNNRVYSFEIKQGVYFHNGDGLTSGDIVYTIDYILDTENQSIYHNHVSNIRKITVTGEYTFEMQLENHDPFIFYKLTFPILPSGIFDDDPPFYPGTGPYRITSYKEGVLKAGLFYERRDSDKFLVDSIRVVELDGTRDAMKAFMDDIIDIVLLDDEYYSLYYLRDDIQMSKYPGNTYIMFQINNENNDFFDDEKNRSYIKSLLRQVTTKKEISDIMYITEFPFIRSAPVASGEVFEKENKYDNVEAFENDVPQIKLVYNSENGFIEKIAGYAVHFLEEYGIETLSVGYEPEEYLEIIQEREYDIALRQVVMDNNPDPSWLFLGDPYERIYQSETLLHQISDEYLQKLNEFETLYLKGDSIIYSDEFSESLEDLNDLGLFLGIGFKYNGVIQSHRIRGRLDSNAFNRFERIEDIWVWAAQ